MSTAEDSVRELIRSMYRSVPQLASAVGIPASSIYSVLRNGFATSSAATLLPLANALGLDPRALLEGNTIPEQTRTCEVPLYGTTPSGASRGVDGACESFPIPEQLHERFPRAFLVRVSGESMNLVLPTGCYALVDPCSEAVCPEAPYALRIGRNRATIKRVRRLSAGLELLPASTDPTFRPMLYDFNDPATPRVQVVGRVVWYTLPYDWHF